MSFVFKELDKPQRKVHPEMKDVQSGDELLVFELKDDDKDISS